MSSDADLADFIPANLFSSYYCDPFCLSAKRKGKGKSLPLAWSRTSPRVRPSMGLIRSLIWTALPREARRKSVLCAACPQFADFPSSSPFPADPSFRACSAAPSTPAILSDGRSTVINRSPYIAPARRRLERDSGLYSGGLWLAHVLLLAYVHVLGVTALLSRNYKYLL